MALFRSSRSEEVVYEAVYDVSSTGDVTASCTCPRFVHHGACVHTEQLERWHAWGQKIDPGFMYPPPTPSGSWKLEKD